MNISSLENNSAQGGTATASMTDIQLSPRQTEFLDRVRKHDHSVKVFFQGDQLSFAGRTLSGLMPTEQTGADEDDGDN